MADPQIGLDVDRVILFERDVDRAQGAGNDGDTAPLGRQPGPLASFGQGASNYHAARRHFHHRGAEAEMGTTQGSCRCPSARRRATYSANGVRCGGSGPHGGGPDGHHG